MQKSDYHMTKIDCFIDKEIYLKVVKYVSDGVYESVCEFVLHSLLFLLEFYDFCREKGEEIEKCKEKVWNFIVESL